MIQDTLRKIVSGQDICGDEATALMNDIADGKATDAQIGCLLAGMRMKGVTTGEVYAFASVLRDRAIPVQSPIPGPLVDTCGTGGDGAKTFNISTAAALVAASAGLAVVKHGNRGVSSGCGSTDVLDALGIRVDETPEDAARSVTNNHISFLFAPKFHPALGRVANARKEAGIFSVFNILGPLLNPAGADTRLIGVGEEGLIMTVAETLKRLGVRRAMVVFGDGTDEITVTGPTKVAELQEGSIRTFLLAPEDFGIARAPKSAIEGGTPVQNAAIITRIFAGEKGPKRDIVVLNAGAALYLGGKAEDLREGYAKAAQAVKSGAAMHLLERLQNGGN